MIRVRTFATPIRIFATIRELQELDEQVAEKVYSMSDTTTAGENGETIGLIRSVVYRTHDD